MRCQLNGQDFTTREERLTALEIDILQEKVFGVTRKGVSRTEVLLAFLRS